MFNPPLTEPDEYGLVYDATAIQPSEQRRDYRGLRGMLCYNPTGMAIFATREGRTAAMTEMVHQGFRYLVTYKDVNGFGLSWCYKPHWPEYMIRHSARRRLPSYREPSYTRRGPSLYRNPAYDSVNDPDPRYLEKSYV